MIFFPLKVKQKRNLTSSACLIVLDVPENLIKYFTFLPGQYVTIQLRDKNTIVQKRCYSLCGPLDSKDISIGVKKVRDGFVSSFLFDDLKIGDTLSVSSANGDFTLQNANAFKNSNNVFISAGSGITPIKSLIESLLSKNYLGKIFLIYGNNNINEVIFLDFFNQIDKKHTNVEIIHILKNTPLKWNGEQGRLIIEKIDKLFTEHNVPLENTGFFISGPQGIIDNSFEYLLRKGVKPISLFSEKFFTAAPENLSQNKTFNAIVKSQGKKHNISFAGNKSILDACLENGINANHSCRTGTCLSCTASHLGGNIHIQNDSQLSEEQKENNIILTCQSYALDNNLEIDYDTHVKKGLLHNRNKLILLASFFGLLLLSFFAFYPKSDSYLIKGEYNVGHEDLQCVHCHQDAEGSIRQQAQYNTKHFFDDNAVDFGKKPVGNNACLSCHKRDNDQHPVHRFLEPKFKDARENIQPEQCISCHAEHQHKRVTLQQTDYCMHCHKEVEIVNDPLDIKHDDLIKLELWNTCIQCHDFHGNHIMETASKLKDTIALKDIENYFNGGEDPYSELKKYIADLDSLNKNY